LQLFFFFPILCFLFSSALKVLLLVAAQAALICENLWQNGVEVFDFGFGFGFGFGVWGSGLLITNY